MKRGSGRIKKKSDLIATSFTPNCGVCKEKMIEHVCAQFTLNINNSMKGIEYLPQTLIFKSL